MPSQPGESDPPRTETRPANRRGVLYVAACAAPPASDVGELVKLAQSDGWTVCVVTSPEGARWVDAKALEELTGYPVRSTYRLPGEGESLPEADAIVVVPATFNTVNKFRYGIADTFLVSSLSEALSTGTPIILAPNVKAILAAHPAFEASLEELRRWGVHVLDQSPNPRGVRIPSWEAILAAVNACT
jgi:phosphopantothenoylcysteine synthetase/decarboxylase